MKDSLSLVIAIAALSYAAVRLYQKYVKKDNNPSQGNTQNSGSLNTKKGDDYEPYSGK